MKRLAQVALSACLSLALMAGVSLTLTGCSADTLSGPTMEYDETFGEGGGTSGSGSDHNTDKAHFDGGGEGGGTSGSGSDHNTDG